MEKEIFKDSLTISTRGEYSGTVTYHEGNFVLANNILVMCMPNLTRNQKLFIGTLIDNLDYSGYPRKETLKHDKIKLPTKKGKIDFEFMDKFINKLEKQSMTKLETYLSITGLIEFQLSEDEISALNYYSDINWKEYRIGDLFERIQTKKLPYKAKELPGTAMGEYVLPCLTSSFMNQGLNYFAPIEGATILKNVISIPSNSDVYRAYFQSREFTVLSDAYTIRWNYNDREITDDHYLFFVQCINKITDLPRYSYKNKLGGWNIVKEKYIKLPSKDNKIDFQYINIFMRAIKKIIIKDVVKYINKV